MISEGLIMERESKGIEQKYSDRGYLINRILSLVEPV